jgi:diaminopimelate decarboxylase
MGRLLLGIVERECAAYGLVVPTLAIEPGRGIVGPGTITVYEVGTVKEVEGMRTFVSVDGGMSDNPRVSLYGSRYTATLANRHPIGASQIATVVGRHCESGDELIRDIELPADIHPGDLLAVACTGAYNHSMASNYNLVGRPPLVSVRDGRAHVLVRRETTADLLARDVG